MKKHLYSAFAILCAISGISATKSKSNRIQYYFSYIGPVAYSSSDVTNLTNWTLVAGPSSFLCSGSDYACAYSTTDPYVSVSGRKIPSVPIQSQQTAIMYTVMTTGHVSFVYNQDLF